MKIDRSWKHFLFLDISKFYDCRIAIYTSFFRTFNTESVYVSTFILIRARFTSLSEETRVIIAACVADSLLSIIDGNACERFMDWYNEVGCLGPGLSPTITWFMACDSEVGIPRESDGHTGLDGIRMAD